MPIKRITQTNTQLRQKTNRFRILAIVLYLAFVLHNEAWYGLHEAMGIWWRYFNK